MAQLTDKEIADIMQVYKNSLENSNKMQTAGFMQVLPSANQYIPTHPCPSCGYCPHCGRGGHISLPYCGPNWTSSNTSYTMTVSN